jgi:predicted MFS family arabinose efflux permease
LCNSHHGTRYVRIAIGAVLGGRVVASSGVHAVTWVGAIVVSISVGLASINALGTRRARVAGR